MDTEQLKRIFTNAGYFDDKKMTRKNLFAEAAYANFATDQVSNRLNAGWKTAQFIYVNDCSPGRIPDLLENWRSLAENYQDQFLLVYSADENKYLIYDYAGNLLGDDSIIEELLEGEEPTRGLRGEHSPTGLNGGNVIYYGVPGSGKSFTIDEIIEGNQYERVVFHPDYTYSDFVGQIMPQLKSDEEGNEKLSYVFVPGPFTKVLKKAIDNPEDIYYLVIEEINRGNAPAIFGDIFQLLDRNADGSGKYAITNFDIAKVVFDNEEQEIRIPANLSILATMNTSDQNVFTLDTAFQRRWDMKLIKNDIAGANHANYRIENSEVTWGRFATVINEALVNYTAELGNSEDKQLGAYFVKENELSPDKFPEKALKYLWDDAFKMDHGIVFNDNIKSLSDIMREYNVPGDPIRRIMKRDVYNKMVNMSAESPAEAIDETEIFEAQRPDGEN